MSYHYKLLCFIRGFDSLHPLHYKSMTYMNVQVKCKYITTALNLILVHEIRTLVE